jgi:hypothetical protein
MGEEKKVFKVLVGKPEGNRPLGRPRRRWEDGIKMYLWETGWEGTEWIHVAEDRDRWRASVNTVMNLRVLAPRSYFFFSKSGCLSQMARVPHIVTHGLHKLLSYYRKTNGDNR